MKRQIAYSLVIFVGFLVLLGHFINYSPLNNFIDNDATQWFDIISGFAAFTFFTDSKSILQSVWQKTVPSLLLTSNAESSNIRSGFLMDVISKSSLNFSDFHEGNWIIFLNPSLTILLKNLSVGNLQM